MGYKQAKVMKVTFVTHEVTFMNNATAKSIKDDLKNVTDEAVLLDVQPTTPDETRMTFQETVGP